MAQMRMMLDNFEYKSVNNISNSGQGKMFVNRKASTIIKRIKKLRVSTFSKNGKKIDEKIKYEEENIRYEENIKYYEFSDFENVIVLDGSLGIRGCLKDDNNTYALRPFYDDAATLKDVINEYLRVRSHENILRYYGTTKPKLVIWTPFLVLEYTDGGTLNNYLQEHFSKLSWNDKFNLAIQLTSVVSFLHDNDIVHRKLNADNIRVHQKNIKLDFFASKETSDSSTNTLYVFSIMPYIDPMSFSIDNYELDNRSDVYAVGVLLWQISSGRQPFHDKTYNASLTLAIINGQRETIIDETPAEYSELYTACWSDDPNKRPDIRQIVSDLELSRLSILSIVLPHQVLPDQQSNDQAAMMIEDALRSGRVNSISFDELKDPEPLDEGGFASIVKVKWNGNYVVYKRLSNTAVIGEQNMLDAFLRELTIYSHLGRRNDHIVCCFGISKDEIKDEYVLVMQYANGGNLRDYLKNKFKDLTWDDKKKLAFQIADGLNYLHKEDVLHRDLHSQNIVIHDNIAKITDFGSAKFQNQESANYISNWGVVRYMEPKRMFDPKFPYTKSSDIYSFGVLMWEISSGHPPFKDSVSRNDVISLACAISNEGAREKEIPGTPKEYEKLYKNCWDPEPKERPDIKDVLNKLKGMNNINEEKELCVSSMNDISDVSETISQRISILDMQELLSDPNIRIRDIFFGSENVENRKATQILPGRNQKLYVVVGDIPTNPLRTIGNFPIVYIERRTFTELGPRNGPPSWAVPLDVKEKFNKILDDQLGLEFRSKFINLTAIRLDWKIVNGYYIEKPAVVFYVIRKGVIPIGNDLFPKTIIIDTETSIETDVREGFYEPTGVCSEDCREYLNLVSSGCSIGIKDTTQAGTLGAFVKDQSGHIYLLTNDHVVRLEHDSEDPKIICQPAESDHIDPFKKKLEDLESQYKSRLDNLRYIDVDKSRLAQDSILEKTINDLRSTLSGVEKKAVRTELNKLENYKNIKLKIKRTEQDLENASNKDIQLASFTKGFRKNYEMNGSKYGVDAAIALVDQELRTIETRKFPIRDQAFEKVSINPVELSGKIIENVESVDNSKPIFKVGRTSGVTKGYIKDVFGSTRSAGDLSMLKEQLPNLHKELMKETKIQGGKNFPSKWLDRQVLVRPKNRIFMDEGDSGCVWFDQNGTIIALGHGTLSLSIGEYAVGSPISAVLKALDVDLYVSEEN